MKDDEVVCRAAGVINCPKKAMQVFQACELRYYLRFVELFVVPKTQCEAHLQFPCPVGEIPPMTTRTSMVMASWGES